MTEEMCYIGRRPCGCVVAAVVIRAGEEKRVAKDVAVLIKEGLAIEQVTIVYVKANLRTCFCAEKGKLDTKQEKMF